ncbi:MAG: DUF2191 domain-containing protein [Bacteroidota bacterium]
MKVTALIPDELIEKVRKISGGKNITESLIIALNEYVKQDKMEKLYDSLRDKPLSFREDFIPYKRNRDR